ncbi:MAG TPA: dienelactone hydrolase family protein [candidate division Zixibacteria bacterium]|nr:dienelactone hydrolase family protein [candidate division Zixibacteria bacterium]
MAQTVDYFVAPNDASLISEMVEFPGNAGQVKAYVSRPRDGKNLGTVIVIHENRGLVDHIKDVARRFAKEGFAAIAVDCMSRLGGSDQYKGGEAAIEAIKNIKPSMVVEDLAAALGYMKKQSYVNGKFGVVGYCWGGGNSLNFATKCKELSAAVVYYGRNPDPLDAVADIPCPLMGNYAADDPNIMPGVEPLKAALTKAGKVFDIKVYPGAKHAFNNNTNADRYHPEAAKDAWERTAGFFKKHLT